MTQSPPTRRARAARPPVRRTCAALAVLAALAAAAATPLRAAPQDAAEAHDDVTRELIEMLAASGALKPEDAARLVARLKAQLAARRNTPPPGTWGAPPTSAAVDANGGVRVTFVPESEKQRIRDEVRRDVIAQAKAENWAQPGVLPEWTQRLRLDGDLRLRGEFDRFDRDNGDFINFQAINAGAPYDTNLDNGIAPPYLNSTRNRLLPRLRVRLGVTADLGEGWGASLRLATGNTTNPVSTNQTLGTDFNKASITLDRAALEYRPSSALWIAGGRIANPWLSTPLVYDEDLAFDGLAARWTPGGDWWVPSLTAGAFSVYNTAFDVPTNSVAKAVRRDRFLFAAQATWQLRLAPAHQTDVGLALYEWTNARGEVSSPCFAPSSGDSCDTDYTRPGFLQKGNTLTALRLLRFDSADTTPPAYQYFGLASHFRVLNLTARHDWSLGDGQHLVATADFARNLAWRYREVRARGPVTNFDDSGRYDGGRNGLLLQLQYGVPKLDAARQWNVALGYRYLQSDAVLDAFTDSDFHLGGTNAKGYTLQANYGLSRNTSVALRWLSATEVTGQPFAVDVVHVDLNARF